MSMIIKKIHLLQLINSGTDEMNCEGKVKKRLNFISYRQCKKKATVERDGHWYCSIHDPVKVAQRQKKSEQHKKEKSEFKKKMYYEERKYIMSMDQIAKRIKQGFQSSSQSTPEWNKFFTMFKKSFTAELKTIGAKDIEFSKGHFYISGFYTIGTQPYYFSISDVRFFPDCRLMYRTANDYKDFTGGTNKYVSIKNGMAKKML